MLLPSGREIAGWFAHKFSWLFRFGPIFRGMSLLNKRLHQTIRSWETVNRISGNFLRQSQTAPLNIVDSERRMLTFQLDYGLENGLAIVDT